MFRYRLRSLFIVTAILAGVLAAFRWYTLPSKSDRAYRALMHMGHYVVKITTDGRDPHSAVELRQHVDDPRPVRAALRCLDADWPISSIHASSLRNVSTRLFEGIQLPSLRVIRWNNVQTDARFWDSVAGMDSLESLLAANTGMKESDLPRIMDLPRLQVLWAGQNEVDFSSVQQPSSSLVALRVNGTKVNDQTMRTIGQMTSLRVLDFSGTEVTDEGLAALVHLQQLRVLSLSHTNVTDQAVEILAQLPDLAIIEITDTGISLTAASELTQCEVVYVLGKSVFAEPTAQWAIMPETITETDWKFLTGRYIKKDLTNDKTGGA